MACVPGGRGGGVIQGTASEAVLVALLAARQAKIDEEMKRVGEGEGEREGDGPGGERGVAPRGASREARQQMEVASRLTAYTSDQAHSCVLKAARVR